MRIVIDARFYGLENTGIGRYTVNLVENLQQVDSENEYFIILRKKYFDSLEFNNNFKKVLGDYPHYGLSEQIFLPFRLLLLRPDMVHFPHFNIPIFYPGKFVVTIHDLLMHHQKGKDATTLPYYMYLIKRMAYKLAVFLSIKRAKRIFVPSNFVKRDLIEKYPFAKHKIETIYEGVTTYKILESTKSVLKKYQIPNENYFIYTGNAYPHKNLERALLAFSKLNEGQKQEVLFVIVAARNVFTKKLEKLIKAHGYSSFTKVLGFVPDPDLGVLYKNSKGFLYPSLHEGFGLPGLEAQSAGTIALVSDINVFHEIYQKSAIYFDPLDENSILDKLEEVLKMNSKERDLWIKKAQNLHTKYSWLKMAQKVHEIYISTSYKLKSGL